MPDARDVVLLLFVLEGVGHVKFTVDGRDAKGRISVGQVRVAEHTARLDGLELRIKDVDRTGSKVGSEQESARLIEAEGEPLVHCGGGRVVDGNYGVTGVDGSVPPGDDALLCGEQLNTRSENGAP